MGTDISQPYFQTGFTAQDFRARHQQFYGIIGKEAVAVVQGGPPVGGFEVFRQTNELFYLTGLEVPQAYLLLDGRKQTSRLYLPRRDAKHAASEGDELTADDAALLIKLIGVDDVAALSALEDDLRGAAVIYTPHNPAEGNMACQDTLRTAARLTAADPWGNQPPRETFFIELLRQRVASARIADLSPVLDAMRAVKTPSEIEMMRWAGKLTALAVAEAMRSTRPGVYEYQLGAIAEYVYRLNGGRGASYRPIIAGGSNIWFIHYYRNNCQLKAGDLVLMDVAPDVCNYTSDIGRMWPVNGKYDDQQRQLYS